MSVDTPTPGSGLEPAAQKSERCTGCGNPLALDQRYCLNCGKRRGGARIEFEKYLEQEPPNQPPKPPTPVAAGPAPDNRPEREVTPLMAAVGLTGLAVILILGVLIGRTGQGNSTQAAPVVATGVPTATTPGATSTTTSTTVSFTADWPAGKEGFTIELATLPKDGADGAAVETAKADLVAQGASEVGALDSDEFASLPAGNYVLYSGVYDTEADAEAALEPLKASFPDAQVVEVSTSASEGGGETEKVTTNGEGFSEETAKTDPDQIVEASENDLEELEGATGDEYQEMQKKLPPTIETPGAPPPKDDKAPGGGSGAVEIG